jgi:hypothetical protein
MRACCACAMPCLLVSPRRAALAVAPFAQHLGHPGARQPGVLRHAAGQGGRQRRLAGALGTDHARSPAPRSCRLLQPPPGRQPASDSTANSAYSTTVSHRPLVANSSHADQVDGQPHGPVLQPLAAQQHLPGDAAHGGQGIEVGHVAVGPAVAAAGPAAARRPGWQRHLQPLAAGQRAHLQRLAVGGGAPQPLPPAPGGQRHEHQLQTRPRRTACCAGTARRTSSELAMASGQASGCTRRLHSTIQMASTKASSSSQVTGLPAG